MASWSVRPFVGSGQRLYFLDICCILCRNSSTIEKELWNPTWLTQIIDVGLWSSWILSAFNGRQHIQALPAFIALWEESFSTLLGYKYYFMSDSSIYDHRLRGTRLFPSSISTLALVRSRFPPRNVKIEEGRYKVFPTVRQIKTSFIVDDHQPDLRSR